jgi:hypothetical protein
MKIFSRFLSETARLSRKRLEIVKTRFFQEIEHLDETILAYSQMLDQAQPLFTGKVVVKFSPISAIQIQGESFRDRAPYVGRMVRRRSGDWVVMRIKNPVFNQLHLLRVGKGMAHDRQVVALLKGLGALLTHRTELIGELTQCKTRISKAAQSLQYFQKNKMKKLVGIGTKVNVDWTTGAGQLYEAFLTQRRTAINTTQSESKHTKKQQNDCKAIKSNKNR